MATLQDIANEANVSIATVSYVLNGKEHKVSKKVGKQILEIAKRLNYQPNQIASALKRKKLNVITLMLEKNANINKKMFKDLIAGILAECSQHGYRLLIDSGRTQKEICDSLLSKTDLYDGSIVQAPLIGDKRIRELVEHDVPFVLIGSLEKKEEIPVLSVDVDNVELAYKVTSKLLKCGHNTIGFLNSEADMTISIDRLNGYQKALQQYGIAYKDQLVGYCDNTKHTSKKVFQKLYEKNKNMTALVVCSDDAGIGVYEVLDLLGKKVPDDLSIVALGGDDFRKEVRPYIATVDIDYYEIGREASNLLIRSLENKQIDTPQILIKPHYCFTKSFVNYI